MGYEVDPAVQSYYAAVPESDRLTTWGRLEAERTRELLGRFLPPAPATVLDVGGAEGAYALPLAAAGYTVRLLDSAPVHIEAARAASATQLGTPLASAEIGDARELPYADNSADAVLLLGPLYHLTDQRDRLKALDEALRVLRPGGVLFAAAISRFASSVDGVRAGLYADPVFNTMIEGDLRDGVHRNPDPTGRPDWFTLAYFHHPDELRDEVTSTGFDDVRLLAIEGIGIMANAKRAFADPARTEALLKTIRRVETEPALLGVSPHLMAIATAP